MQKKILIVNDDKSLREIFQLYLELKGYHVELASDGEEGLKQALEIQPDLILLDIMMPGMNGYEVCTKLKEDGKTKEIPVIFLSSLMSTSDKIKGLESGGVDFINNTADQAEILARVETHLKIRALTQEIMASNQELLAKQKILNENLKAAATIQQILLPSKQIVIPHAKVAWSCQSCEWVGGDICNFIQVDDERVIFYVLDVSGHGVSSAMVTVSIYQSIQQQNHHHFSLPLPKQVLTSLNQEYPFEKFNMFSTIFYMILNPQNGKLLYSSAGHPPPVHLSPNRMFSLLNDAGAMIGIDSTFIYEDKEEMLMPGDKLILYTDGVIEFRNSQRELYGSEKFYHLLETIKHKSIEEMIQIVNESLNEFGKNYPPQDDVSMMIIEFNKR